MGEGQAPLAVEPETAAAIEDVGDEVEDGNVKEHQSHLDDDLDAAEDEGYF